MTQRRSTQNGAWAQAPATWFALAVAFAAISVSNWVQALGGEKDLAYLPAVAFTAAALSFVWRGRQCARQRSKG